MFLFYVDGGRAHGCLLIYIVFDPPGGHPFLKSKAPPDIRLVRQLESIAENFSVWGKIA